jgi:fatty acid desaturase
MEISETEKPKMASNWPPHIAQRRWYGWTIATLYWLTFFLVVVGQLSIHFDKTQPMQSSTGQFALLLFGIFLMFYAFYWFIMFFTYYAPKWISDLFMFVFDIFSIFK